jgi:molybdopterin molybdotransferase/putative molybdopterin biosynthesis protein
MEYRNDEALPRADALQAFRDRWRPEPRVEEVVLSEAFGRVLARDLVGQCDLPVVRASRFDGYALRSEAFAACAPGELPDTSAWVEGTDFARADTGDDFPDAFDMVVAVESTCRGDDGSLALVPDGKFKAGPGAGVSPRGSVSRAGELVAPAHTRLSPECVAAAAVAGYAQVPVLARPRVAFIPTGAELVAWGSFPARGQNIEANSLLVRGMVEEWGGEALTYPLVPDERASVGAALDRALAAADIVVLNAGSSLGGDDFNAGLLAERASYFRHGVRAVPGRPVGMAIVDGTPVVNAPGPVLAAWLCMDWLVRGLVAHWYGVPVVEQPRVRARLAVDVADAKPRERIVRVLLEPGADGIPVARPVEKFGVPQTLVGTDALFTLPADVAAVRAGELVEVELLRPWELTGAGRA